LRFAPEGTLQRRVLARLGLLPDAVVGPSRDNDLRQAEENNSEVARAAGSSA